MDKLATCLDVFGVLVVVLAATFFVAYLLGAWSERSRRRQAESRAGSVTQAQRQRLSALCRRFDVPEPNYSTLTFLEARLLIEEPGELLENPEP